MTPKQRESSLLGLYHECINIIDDIRIKSFNDNKGNYICHIPKELMEKMQQLLGVK